MKHIVGAIRGLRPSVHTPSKIQVRSRGGAARCRPEVDIQTRGLRGYVTIEASGNINFEDLEAWQSSKVDVISTSGLHRAAPRLQPGADPGRGGGGGGGADLTAADLRACQIRATGDGQIDR